MNPTPSLYDPVIIDHHRAPRNAGRLADPTHVAERSNPLCGDRLVVTARLVEGRVVEVRCDVRGCAVCRASGSMMTEAVQGRSSLDARRLAQHFMSAIAGTSEAVELAGDDALGALSAFLPVRQFPSRLRCATLPWEALLALGSSTSDPPPAAG